MNQRLDSVTSGRRFADLSEVDKNIYQILLRQQELLCKRRDRLEPGLEQELGGPSARKHVHRYRVEEVDAATSSTTHNKGRQRPVSSLGPSALPWRLTNVVTYMLDAWCPADQAPSWVTDVILRMDEAFASWWSGEHPKSN